MADEKKEAKPDAFLAFKAPKDFKDDPDVWRVKQCPGSEVDALLAAGARLATDEEVAALGKK